MFVCVCSYCDLSVDVIVQVPDVETAFQFRKDMYAMMGVEMPQKPVKKVLFWFRQPPLGRSVSNSAALRALADAYNVPYTYGGSSGCAC